MVDYTLQYNKVGVSLIRHFLEPPIILASSYVFPDNSVFYWFKPTDGIERVSRTFPYLAKTNKAVVITPTKYSKKVEGGFTLDNDKVKFAYDKIVKEEKRYKFLKPDTIESSGRDLTIYNYGILNYVNDYKSDVKNKIYKYYNASYRLIEDLKSLNNANRFILIDIPNKLPNTEELDVFATKSTVGNMVKLDYKYYNLIELWKWLTPSVKQESIFNGIANHKLDKTTLLISMDTKVVLLNLGFLYNIVEEYKDNKYAVNNESLVQEFFTLLGLELNQEALNGQVAAYPASMIRNLLYILVYQLVNGKSVNLERISSIDTDYESKRIVSEMKKIEKEKKLSLSSIIEEFAIQEKSGMIDLSIDSDFDDSVFDISKLEADEAALKQSLDRTFDSIEELKKYKYQDDAKMKTISELSSLYESKLISKKQYMSFLASIDKQDKIKNPYLTTETIDKALDYDMDSFNIDEKDATVAKSVLLFDEAVSKNTLGSLQRKYLREQYRKDIIRCVYSLQNYNNIILDYKVTDKTDIMGSVEEHRIEVLNLSGKKTTLTFEIPYIDEEGVIRLNGTKYTLRSQRTEVVCRKIDATTVVLNTYYGKLFINKANANNAKVSVGKWFLTMLLLKQDSNKPEYDKKLVNVNAEGSSFPDVKLPLLYAQIASYTKYFTYDSYIFNFNYSKRLTITDEYKEEDIIGYEGSTMVLVASKGKELIFLDFTNNLHSLEKGKLVNIGSIFEFLNINPETLPIEYAGVVLLKEYTPLVFLLGYYMGLENLLKVLKVNYTLYDGNKRVELTNNQYSVRFKDKKLVIDKDNGLGNMILGGLIVSENVTKLIQYGNFNNRAGYAVVFNKLFKIESNVRYVNEIKLLETMFIDPMTLNVLKATKQPESFIGLLIAAAELLLNNDYGHPNNLKDMLIKGYERVAGFIYKELILALKDYENKSVFSKANFVMDKYAIMNKLNEDSTKVVVDDLNPIATIKQKEDLSYLGVGGRSKETMVKSTRELHSSEIGVVSEATKDSGSVGITAYMTASPLLDNTTGIIKDNANIQVGWQNLLSTTGMLAPFSINDDTKRLDDQVGAVTWETV